MYARRLTILALLTLALAACAPSTRQIDKSTPAEAPVAAKAESPTPVAAAAPDRSGPKVVAATSQRAVAYAGEQKPSQSRDRSTRGTASDGGTASESASSGQSGPSTVTPARRIDERTAASPAEPVLVREPVDGDRRLPWGLLGLLGLLGVVRRRPVPRDRIALEPTPPRFVRDRRVGVYERPG